MLCLLEYIVHNHYNVYSFVSLSDSIYISIMMTKNPIKDSIGIEMKPNKFK